MSNGKQEQKEQKKKIVLPEDVQIEMMKFFLRTSIPRIKKKREEQARLSNKNDRSEK